MFGLASITADNGVAESGITLEVALFLIYILFAALLGLTLLALNMARRSNRRVSQVAANVEQQLLRMREHTQLPGLLEELVHEIDGLSARVTSHLNSRFVPLEKAVRRVDQRILRLESQNPAKTKFEPEAPAPSNLESSEDTVDRTSDDTPAVAGAGTKHVATRTGRTARIYELADTGKKPLDIAAELGVPVGEVELILNLRTFGSGGN